jgi:hypothetical protein
MSTSSQPLDLTADLIRTLQRAVQARFPAASFDVRISPEGRVYLSVYCDAPSDFEVQDLVAEHTVDALIHHDVKIHVFPRATRQSDRR